MPKIAVPSAAPQGEAAGAAVLLPGRQEGAEAGKELPDAVLGLDGKGEDQPDAGTDSEDDDKEGEDAPASPFAWFATAQMPVAPPAAKAETIDALPGVKAEAAGKTRGRREVQLPDAPVAQTEDAPVVEAAPVAQAATVPVAKVAAAVPGIVAPEVKLQPAPRRGEARPARTDAAPAAPSRAALVDPEVDAAAARAVASATTTDAPVPKSPALASSAPKSPAPASLAPVAQAPHELRQAAAEAPVVRIALDRPAPPRQVSIADVTQGQREAVAPLGEAAAPAAFELPQPRTAASDPQVDLSTLSVPTTGTQTATAVAATAQGQGGTLDTRHQEWTSQMIDKIEALRDAAPLRETKISLMPEGLGKLDIAIRQDDAGMHVAFSTDTQAARQLISDAQPKLAEIAQERGIRIVSSSVESNATGNNGGSGTGSSGASNPQMHQGQRQDAAPNRHQPSAPPSARRGAETSTNEDERVA
ncbi:flagellar hook-length control protein FliK [Sphingomonas sp. KR3-1]|uniref:flagellar hook-length control protein FliK n=1 Tax=Sphingomonas sp. KR3-1 TaxID=3156611 RepID=UPI0032B56085